MEDQWRISKHDRGWKDLFNDIALKLRNSLGNLAIRIDHVGSTSIDGLDAKPIIDIQISVLNYDDIASYKTKIESVGFVFRDENPDKTKRYFRELPGTRRTHIHVRQVGSFSEQMTLLFRDYIRQHPQDCLRYAEEKHRLMELYKNERPKYVEGKGPIVWDILQKAHNWSQEVGWQPGRSDN
ncbi:GrpB family protein [Paenibacillus sp. GCM10023248]|uniref:GrpB family protein n=1 Tax=unclassified Paenibacillus TaxID=185978 RepID=UPI0023794AA1|nr:GrpB family protein [Paenibacillus sp. MAHUQ-63]MDD9271898.1 GrpB family protein [Paenibacillus sp. MAHUQ-63]